jgi:hypothetical protein
VTILQGRYHLIYDAGLLDRSAYELAIGVGVLFVALGLALVLVPGVFDRDRDGRRHLRMLGAAIVAVSTMGTATSRAEMHDNDELRRRLASGEYVRVEGRVTGYVPGDQGGHDDEEWTVESGGRRYRYAFRASEVGPGYRRTLGPVRLGSRVRIADVDGQIARLELWRWW